MKNNIIKTFALFALLLWSCTKADFENPITGNEESVNISLSLSVDTFSAGTAEALSSQTQAIGDNEDPSTEIINLWVIQVNGTTDDSKVVASRYINDYSDKSAEIEFIPNSKDQTVICLANTFHPSLSLGLDATLADVKALKWDLKDDDDYCYTHSGTKYMYMSGTTITPILGNDNIKVKLKRSIAKVNFTIDNIANSNLIITSIAMNGVPEIGNYYVNRDDLAEIFPLAPEVYNYTTIKELNIIEGDDSKTFTFYLPTNKQGTSDKAVNYTKPLYANLSASYITVVAKEASAKNGNDIGVYRYTFYLGANLDNDYNIEPNKEYTYNVNFKSKGSVGTDLRIKDLGSVDWRNRESSNCYILNPVAEANRVFYIPIEERTEKFWGNINYGNNKSKIITEDIDWTYEVLWYDCATNPITIIDPDPSTMKIEKADNNNGMYQEALKVTLGKGFNNWGNVVVAVKDKDGSSISWSWHLWITDYNPDSHTYTSRETGAYAVDGGEIHRYDGKLWEPGGVYADKFIMDRNLGARVAHTHNGSGAGAIYYQWGSKNPIPGKEAKFADGYGDGSSPKLAGTEDGVSFATATENPTTHYFITDNGKGENGFNWCNQGISLSTTHFWNDHNIKYDSANPNYAGKSIFDPSPLGWKLPINGTWSDFDFNKHPDDNNKMVYPKFPWDIGSRIYNKYAYYPAAGDRNGTGSGTGGGGLGSVYGSGHYWSATPSSNFSGYFLSLSNSTVNTSNNRPRSYGFPVRPIKE